MNKRSKTLKPRPSISCFRSTDVQEYAKTTNFRPFNTTHGRNLDGLGLMRKQGYFDEIVSKKIRQNNAFNMVVVVSRISFQSYK